MDGQRTKNEISGDLCTRRRCFVPPDRIDEGRDRGLFVAEEGQAEEEEEQRARAVLARMMPQTSHEEKLTQETKKGNSGAPAAVAGKLQPIGVRPTEVEGREGSEVIVEDARVKAAMGSPKVDAVSGDGAAKGTPDKVGGASSSSSSKGMDSGGSPAAPAIKSGSGSTRGGEGEPEGSPGEPGPPAESSSSAAPSIASHGGGSGPHWDRDILHLLDDLDGVQLFKEYLEQEQLGHYLQFYFFCNGFRELTVESPAKLRKIIKMACRDYVAGAGVATSKPSKRIECLGDDVRNAIASAARNPGDTPDMNMFDAAQEQVLDFMRRTSYIKFFESDIYIDYMQSLQTRDSSSSKPHSSASSVSGRHMRAESAIDQILDYLPTLSLTNSPAPLNPTMDMQHGNNRNNHRYNTFDHPRAAIAMNLAEPFLLRFCNAILGNTTIRVGLYLIGGLVCSILDNYVKEYRKYFYTAQPKNRPY